MTKEDNEGLAGPKSLGSPGLCNQICETDYLQKSLGAKGI